MNTGSNDTNKEISVIPQETGKTYLCNPTPIAVGNGKAIMQHILEVNLLENSIILISVKFGIVPEKLTGKVQNSVEKMVIPFLRLEDFKKRNVGFHDQS